MAVGTGNLCPTGIKSEPGLSRLKDYTDRKMAEPGKAEPFGINGQRWDPLPNGERLPN